MKVPRILLIVNTLLLVGIWVFAGVKYAGLPEIIPVHFNAQGNVDGEGGKAMIWGLPSVATFIHLVFIGVSGEPNSPLLNVPQSLRNRESLQKHLFSLQLPIMLLFLDILVESVRVAEGKQTALSSTIFFLLGLLLAMIGVNVVKSIKEKVAKSNH